MSPSPRSAPRLLLALALVGWVGVVVGAWLITRNWPGQVTIELPSNMAFVPLGGPDWTLVVVGIGVAAAGAAALASASVGWGVRLGRAAARG